LLEFKNAFRKLGIGLTSQDIDYLVNYCDKDRDGEVDYEEFASKFRPNVSESILIRRTQGRLKNI
jgi:Ca2+-binding EF-hand superfamily protein